MESITHSFIPSSGHIFIHSFFPTFLFSFLHSLLHSFIHSFLHSFFYSFLLPSFFSSIHSFLHSFFYSFIQLFRNPSYFRSYIPFFTVITIHCFICLYFNLMGNNDLFVNLWSSQSFSTNCFQVVCHLLKKELLNRVVLTVLLEDIPGDTKMTLVTSH